MTADVDTRCVMFTDLVSSTELRVRLGEEAADRFQRVHDALIANAVAEHDGTVVKYLGDGVLATFEAATEAVAAAIAVQRSAHEHSLLDPAEAFRVRIGISVGDLSVERGDVFGTAVVEAARLCAVAGTGEILVADIVRALARGRGGYGFEPMGDLELKGLPDPVPACRVAWEPVESEDRSGTPIPPLLLGVTTVGYVGRAPLLERLSAAWSAVAAGRSAALLLGGEPGIGKTRTAAEVARIAHREGALVLYGRCEEDLGLPYQPFVEALDHHTRHSSRPVLGRLPGELVRLLPDLGERVPDLPASVASDPRTEEHRLLAAVASWLSEASAQSGLVLVLDDLHWATRGTLTMLEHAVREATATDGPRLLVVGTFRDSDLHPEHPFSLLLGDLAPVAGVERIALSGLSDADIARFLEEAAGHELNEGGRQLAALLRVETEGNPFFLGEVVRHLVETGAVRRDGDRWSVPDVDSVAVPEGVRDVVLRRLSRLGEATRQVLTVAAVIGRDIDVDVLCAVADHPEDTIIDALDDALRARLVEEIGADHYRFSHALLKTVLGDQLSATRRRRVHRRAAVALEKIRPHDVSALAHHFIAGGPDHGDTRQAVRYSLAAGDRALAARAVSEAESYYRTALDLLNDDPEASPAARVEGLLGLGQALRDQGDSSFREVLLDAGRRAQLSGDTDRLVQAALTNHRGITSVIGGRDLERVELIEAALAALPPDRNADRARLLARLSSEVSTTDDDARAFALCDEALDTARRAGDSSLTSELMTSVGHAVFRPGRERALPALWAEAVAAADELGDPTQRVWSRIWRSVAELAVGEITACLGLREEAAHIAHSEGLPALQWASDTNRALGLMLRGAFAEAQELLDETLALGTKLGEPDAEAWWGAVMTPILMMREGPEVLVQSTRAFADLSPDTPVWRTAEAYFLVDSGRHEEARALIERHQWDPVRLSESVWSAMSAAHLSECALRLHDRALAGRCLEVLEKVSGGVVHFYISSIGPADHFLARARLALGDVDGAIDAHEGAEAQCVRHGARAWLYLGRLGMVEALVQRGRSGDLERAAALRAEAREMAEEDGATSVATRLAALRVP